MPKIQYFFVTLVFLFLFSTFANAQEIPPSYGFVEVVDSQNKPVADASVCRGDCEKVSKNEASLIEKTNQNGLMEKGIRLYGDEYKRPFSIYKDGFYPFFDNFQLFKFLGYGWKNNKDKPLKIELLKIPKNRTETKALGDEQKKRELFWAIYNKDTETLRRLLKSKISPDLKTGDLRGVPVSESIPAIVYASDLLNNEAIEALLSAGADICSKDSPAKNVLINYLLAIPQTYPDSQNKEAEAKRMIDYEKGVELLLKGGADIHFVDSNYQTALTIAMSRGFLGIFKKLLAADFSPSEKGETFRRLIIFKDDKDPQWLEFADLLIKSGANINYLFGNEEFISPSSCASLLMTAGINEKLEFAKLLLKNKADVNFRCKDQNSPLISAVAAGKIELVKLFLDSGAKFYVSDTWAKTALIKAVETRNIAITKLLIERNAPINAADKWGHTALLEATLFGRGEYELVELLLKSGADPNKGDMGCRTPLKGVISYRKVDIIKLLIEYKADVDLSICPNEDAPISTAARSNSPTVVKFLLEAGADVKGEQGRRALNYANEYLKKEESIKANAEEIIKLLKAAGAK